MLNMVHFHPAIVSLPEHAVRREYRLAEEANTAWRKACTRPIEVRGLYQPRARATGPLNGSAVAADNWKKCR
jgi:hypothetical protein